MNIDVLNTLLDRNIGFINNCDTKTSIGLAVNGVFIAEIIGRIDKGLLCSVCKIHILIPLAFLILGAACFIRTLWARHVKSTLGGILTSVWENEEYCNKRNLTFCQAVNSVCDQRIKCELIEQIKINAALARKKYKWYNLGLLLTIVGALYVCCSSVIQMMCA